MKTREFIGSYINRDIPREVLFSGGLKRLRFWFEGIDGHNET